MQTSIDCTPQGCVKVGNNKRKTVRFTAFSGFPQWPKRDSPVAAVANKGLLTRISLLGGNSTTVSRRDFTFGSAAERLPKLAFATSSPCTT